MQLKLFKDSETFILKRPKIITEKQESELLIKMAKEIIENGWSDSPIEDIVLDLETLSHYDTGYELAKDLEHISSYSNYNINVNFIEWLCDFHNKYSEIIEKNIKDWVNVHNIKPKLENGSKLKINSKLTPYSKFNIGDVIFINNIHKNTATYSVSLTLNDNVNDIYDFEAIENKCTYINK